MDQASSVVCICETHEQTQRATYNLQMAGIDMEKLSIATRDDSSGGPSADAVQAGDQTFFVPGIGPLIVSGPLASWLAKPATNGVGEEGVSIIGRELATLGIPSESVTQYEDALKTGKYLLVLHGVPNAIATAVKVIGGTTHCSHTVHGERVSTSCTHPVCLPRLSTISRADECSASAL